MSQKLNQALVSRGLLNSRSQADKYVGLGYIYVNNTQATDPNQLVADRDAIKLDLRQNYVSRAGLKLMSIANNFNLRFKDKVVLDVGSSTGGFSDYALQNGAAKIIAVEVGTNQLHPSLRSNSKIELHEQTDILDLDKLSSSIDIILVDVSFISLRSVLPKLKEFAGPDTKIVVLFKPQFEASDEMKHNGIIKNDKIRRKLTREFETWLKNKGFIITDQSDSVVHGLKGNRERFYSLLVSKA